jgi:hypothetical protein
MAIWGLREEKQENIKRRRRDIRKRRRVERGGEGKGGKLREDRMAGRGLREREARKHEDEKEEKWRRKRKMRR